MTVELSSMDTATRAPRAARAVLMSLATGISFAIGAAGAGTAVAQSARPCKLKLIVQFSPEVPDPRNSGFLSSLEGRPGFRLVWKSGSKPNMTQTLELSGPGPESRCMREVERMRNDARVINIQVAGH